jgi:hypothetical protein
MKLAGAASRNNIRANLANSSAARFFSLPNNWLVFGPRDQEV